MNDLENSNEEERLMTKIKPIRPTVISFETDEEYDEFVRWAESTEKDNSIGMQRAREIMKKHKPAERMK